MDKSFYLMIFLFVFQKITSNLITELFSFLLIAGKTNHLMLYTYIDIILTNYIHK